MVHAAADDQRRRAGGQVRSSYGLDRNDGVDGLRHPDVGGALQVGALEEVDADAPKKFAVPDSMRGFAPAEHVSDKHDPGEIIHYVAFEVTLGMTIDGFDKTARGAFCYFAAAELGLDHDAIVVTSVIPRSRDALEESSSVYVQGEVIVDSMMSAVMVAAALEDPELKLVDETMFGPCSVSNVRMSTKLAPTPSWHSIACSSCTSSAPSEFASIFSKICVKVLRCTTDSARPRLNASTARLNATRLGSWPLAM